MKYRIVADDYGGYEVQVKRWWWPFWYQYGFTNTHQSLEKAQWYVDNIIKRNIYKEGKL